MAVWDLRADNRTYVGVRLVGENEWTNEAVGIKTEHFRLVAMRERPHWERVLTEPGDARRVALHRLITGVAAMPVIEDAFGDDPVR